MARDFPGSVSNALCISNPTGALDITGTVMSIAAWIRPTATGIIAAKDGGGATTCQYQLSLNVNKPAFFIGDSSNVDSAIAPTGAMGGGAWQHLVGVKDGTGAGAIRIYVDGVLAASATSNRTIQDTAQDFCIGARGALGATGPAMAGSVADVAVWHAVLTANEIAALAKGSSPLRVHPKDIAAYFPLWGASGASVGEPDLSGNRQTLSKIGAVGVTDHAPVGPYVLM